MMPDHPAYRYDERGCQFDALPFYWSPLDSADDNQLPTHLPMRLEFDPAIGLLRQIPQAAVTDALDDAYRAGSEIVGLMAENGIGQKYAEDFLSFIDSSIGLSSLKNHSVLEIGCGTGYLLHMLAEQGANITGYEPGYAKLGRYDLPVIEKQFPSDDIGVRKFDLIIAFALLEHIVDPIPMLHAVRNHLGDHGSLIVAVPDCERHIAVGDMSMLLHEHFSYFTKASLGRVVGQAGFSSRQIARAGFGGCIYGHFKKGSGAVESDSDMANFNPDLFRLFDSQIERFESYLRRQAGKSIAIYVPIRGMNLLHMTVKLIDQLEITLRFIDDAATLAGKYLPGFDARIESGHSLIADPTEAVLIFSYQFGDEITDRLRSALPKDTEITSIREL